MDWYERPYVVLAVRRVRHVITAHGFYNRITLRFTDGAIPSEISLPLGQFKQVKRRARRWTSM